MYSKFGQFIDGKWQKSSSNETYDVINPSTEEVIGKASKASSTDIEKALKSAEKGFMIWKKVYPWERALIIRKIADNNPKFGLAISLHSANDSKRSRIMEINKTNNLSSLLSSLKYFYEKTKIKPTYEYILLNGVNDSIQDAKDLIDFCKKTPSKVNLIEYNQVSNVPYRKSSQSSTKIFMDLLEKNKILVKFRRSRGEDIGAACGQLATQNKT